MKWLQNWFDRRVENSWNRAAERKQKNNNISLTEVRDDRNGLQIQVTNAVGGRVVQISMFDKQRHEYNYTTYIITDEQDFNHELAKAITAESLKAV